MRKKLKNKGFSLVELLAVVVILGILATIGVVAVNSLIDKAKKEEMDSKKNTVIMAAQTYMQNNKNLVPKIIGETIKVKLSDLKNDNYITEDIVNSAGESCMEHSYVRVYKLSKTEYTYTAYIYCGNEEPPEVEDVPSPVITAKFSDSTGEIQDEILNNVSDAYLYIDLSAAKENEIEDYKNQGTDIQIDGYSFKIFVVLDGKMKEAYNSGSLSAGREEKLLINKPLKDYIDVTSVTEVSLEVTAINTIGGISHSNTTVGEHGSVGTTEYDDRIPPRCVKPDSPFSEGDWLNKNEYNTSKNPRKLTVGCDDGRGSQCIRTYFTESWPNDKAQYGAEYVYIEVKDNAGNVSEKTDECRFRVNVDIKTPSAKITAYAGAQSNSNDTNTLSTKTTGSNILKKTVEVDDATPTTKINPTDAYYKNLVGVDSEKWMNNTYYPNGVVYKIEVEDNIRLDKWTWNTNEGHINSVKSDKYQKVNGTNPEASNGMVPQDEAHGMTHLHGSTKDTIYVRFLTEGMRYGVLTIYDKAGNSIKINIAAHIDRTAPPIPNSINAFVYNKVRDEGTKVSSTAYPFKTWTNRYVSVETTKGQDRDNLSNNVSLSGFWQYYYYARNNAGNRVGTSDYHTYSSGKGIYNFKGSAASIDGVNKIQFMGCDKANNCSEWSNEKEVWIDITIPVCTVTKTITAGKESEHGWLGINETARVTATCTDPTDTLASGCTVSSYKHDYNYEINTNKAGAEGNGKAGSFTDYAGNTINCTADKRIQIDYHNPKCSVSGGSTSWTNKSRTVTGTCSDTGGSGCAGNISHTYNYDIETSTGGAAGNGNGGSVKDKADNTVSCAANQTVKVDRTNPYVTVDVQPGVYESNNDIDVTITCHDALSGLSSRFDKSFIGTVFAPTTGMYVGKCCEDKAGNLMCDDRGLYKIKIYGRHEDCGAESYKTCQHPDCGTKTSYGTGLRSRGGGSCSSINGSWLNGKKYTDCVRTTSSLDDCTCTTSWSTTKTCETAGCGVKYHAKCWHYGYNCNDCPH